MPRYQAGLTRAQALRQAERALLQPRPTAPEVQVLAFQLAAQVTVTDAQRAVHRLAQLLYNRATAEEIRAAQGAALRAVRAALGKEVVHA